jgi:tetratricopeptide (TPR) repeat protein
MLLAFIRFLVVLLCGVGAAMAQQQPKVDPVLKPELDSMFQQVLQEPANLDLNFRFAELATRAGDFEAAIGALERLLFYNSDLPRVRLELGVLYFRLGSYEMARSYFASAVAAPDTPREVVARVSGFLTEIDRRTQTTQFSFYAQAGLRYQTNANSGPNGALVRALGTNALLTRQFQKRGDWNAFALAVGRYVHDFENQRGDTLEAQLTLYGARQFRIQRLNLALAEVQIGPRLAIAPDALPGWSVKPYLIANAVNLGDNPYTTSLGGGVTMAIPLAPGYLLEPSVEYRGRQFFNSSDYATARLQTGNFVIGALGFSGPLYDSLRVQAKVSQARNDARLNSNSYQQTAFDIAFPYEFEPPFLAAMRWTATPFIGFAVSHYDKPDPLVDPLKKRRDREFRVGLGLDAPISANFGLGVQVIYSSNTSNLPNYRTRNLSVSVGPTVRF